MSDGPIPPSTSLRELLEQLSADQLSHILACKRARAVRATVRRSLSAASVEDLADRIIKGERPTIGWWRRNSQPPRCRPAAAGEPPAPTSLLPVGQDCGLAS